MTEPTKTVAPYSFLTDAEKAAICEQVAECGNVTEAARRVVGDRRTSAVHAAARNDVLGFGAAIEAAKERHRNAIRDEIKRRAFGYEKELTYQGVRTGDTITEVSDNLLLAYARMNLPEYTDRKTANDLHIVSDITITEQPAGVWSISDAEAMALPDELRAQLAGILKHLIRQRRELGRAQKQFDALADQSSAVDVEYTEIESETARLDRELAEVL